MFHSETSPRMMKHKGGKLNQVSPENTQLNSAPCGFGGESFHRRGKGEASVVICHWRGIRAWFFVLRWGECEVWAVGICLARGRRTFSHWARRQSAATTRMAGCVLFGPAEVSGAMARVIGHLSLGKWGRRRGPAGKGLPAATLWPRWRGLPGRADSGAITGMARCQSGL